MIATLDIIATFAIALVGARVAADRRMDYGGILLIATVASITGGSLRNLFLGERPIWLQQPWYFLSILFEVAITIALRITKPLAPGMPYAHPTVEHFAPIFITLGAATNAEVAPQTVIDGYWMGLSKRSFQVA